jgi:hypothetical protein
MKKLFIISVLVSLTIHGLFAQRVDIDRSRLLVKTRHMPYQSLPPEYKTYVVQFFTTPALQYLANDINRAKVNISTWRRLDDYAHLKVTVKLEDLILTNSEVKERVDIIKNKEGKETGRKYYYKVVITYNFAAVADISDVPNNKLISSLTLATRDANQQYNSSEYDSYKGAADYFNNNKYEIKTQLAQGQMDNILASLSHTLSDNYGFASEGHAIHLWFVDSKKHPEYKASQDACNTLKNALLKLTAEDSISKQIMDSVNFAADYFEKLPAKYSNIEEKADKKIRYMAYYNLALASFYTDQPDKAMAYAQKIIENDYDGGDGKDITKDAQKLIADLARLRITTRHFPLDLSLMEPPR